MQLGFCPLLRYRFLLYNYYSTQEPKNLFLDFGNRIQAMIHLTNQLLFESFFSQDLEDKLSIDMNACQVSEEADEEARERRISAQLQKYTRDLQTYVTSTLEVPEVKQDQLKTAVQLNILKTLSEHLEGLYIATRDMVSETCKCSEDLKRDFYDFAYHGLRADHNELVHRFKDLEYGVQKMSEEEKEELQRLKVFQLNRQSLIKELEEKWRALFSPVGY